MKHKARFSLKIIPYVLSAVFFVSALLKVLDINEFVTAIVKYGFFNTFSFVKMSAGVFIIVELLIAFLLIYKKSRFAGLFSALFIISFFVSLAIYSLIYKLNFQCGCFGKFGGRINDLPHILFVLSMLLVTIVAIEYEYANNYVFKKTFLYKMVFFVMIIGPLLLTGTFRIKSILYRKKIIDFIEQQDYEDEVGRNIVAKVKNQYDSFIICFIPNYKPGCDYHFYRKLNEYSLNNKNEMPVVAIFTAKDFTRLTLKNIKKLYGYDFSCVIPQKKSFFQDFLFYTNPFSVKYESIRNNFSVIKKEQFFFKEKKVQ